VIFFAVPRHLKINYHVNFWWGLAKMKVWHPWQLKKLKFLGPIWSYQLNRTANSAPLAHFCGKWAGLAMLFSK
jgi:hypothetical protein